MKSILILAALLAFITPAGAMDVTGNYIVIGAGNESCGKWMSARTESDGNNSFKSNRYRVWLGGYITGYNSWVPGKENIAEGTDVAGLMAWIDNYCAKAPLDNVGTAASALIQHLKSR